MKCRLLAMDLDETLLSADKHVSEKNREALKKARDMGIRPVIATGRPYFSFRHTLEEIGLDQAGEYSISLNGGALVENEQGKALLLSQMDFPMIKALFEKGVERDVCIHVYTLDEVYVWNLNEDEKAFLKGRLPIIELEQADLSELETKPFVKILFENTDLKVLHQIEEELRPLIDDLDVSYSSNRYLEFNPKHVSKGSGLKKLAALLDLTIEECAAIGDHLNDLDMITTAGIGIGVANAVEPVKKVCTFVTQADHDHDAVAEAVETLIKMNEQNQDSKD